ncbi:ATP-binding protein [Actinoplanes sp. NPDC051494]|uniref:ATP-binding protein n=1 Tax=Actinoplanes sp. NPDC051494 TaxID=3363907 RepID=UPI0037BB4649
MKTPRSAPVPVHAAELRRWELTSGDDLRTVRAELARELRDRRLADDQLCERMTLVATELGSNALRHGLPPVHIMLLRSSVDLILAVSDRDVAGVPRSVDAGGVVAGGRGLPIVSSLSDDLCWQVDGQVKYVWAAFLPPGGDPTAG